MATPEAIAQNLGHPFKKKALLLEALTPRIAGLPHNNQRLEYLGDALLYQAVSLLIYSRKPDWDEGHMSKLRATLVNTDSLVRWAEDIGIELIRGPRTPQQARQAVSPKALADAMEALLAAVHLDVQATGGDGLATVMALIERRFAPAIELAYPGIWELEDPKTTLQERAAALGLPAPAYKTLERTGPDHQPQHRAEVTVGPHLATGKGGSIKQAQADAAGQLLRLLPPKG